MSLREIDALIAALTDGKGLGASGSNGGWREWEDKDGHDWVAEWDSEGVRVIDITLARKVVG